MHVLMLGWEFPPFITGGLGTACYGLTKAMDRRGMRVTFVLPKSVGAEHAAHVDLISPVAATAPDQGSLAMYIPGQRRGGAAEATTVGAAPSQKHAGFERTTFIPVEASFVQPYSSVAGDLPVGQWINERGELVEGPPPAARTQTADGGAAPGHPRSAAPIGAEYGGDLIDQVERYANFCLQATRHLDFDVIHAHDWMTYPAGLWIARVTGKPLVVHVHSTEFDRSGENVNQRVYDIERRGMHGAMRVVCVSQLTKNIVVHRYGVPEGHVDVVYNGVNIDPQGAGLTGIRSKDKIVLYFGRITFQKGPEYFIRAAKRVLERMDNVKFVVAGSGDMARHMIEMAANMGIGHKVLFTGFLRGNDIKRVFSLADLYVMPSVSEPFGIAPLEAMSHDVPVIISKSSGVSEVLTHVLKVDFWDIDDMANKIIAILKHPPLSQTLREHGAFEVRRITWDGAAQRCESIYNSVIREVPLPVGAGAS
jgi:glycosyltransferase involved in cell wall biosynthesis